MLVLVINAEWKFRPNFFSRLLLRFALPARQAAPSFRRAVSIPPLSAACLLIHQLALTACSEPLRAGSAWWRWYVGQKTSSAPAFASSHASISDRRQRVH